MRRLLTLLALTLALATAHAQSDSAFVTQSAVDDTAYYMEELAYQKPVANPLRLFGSPFCEHFMEASSIVGVGDIALGISYAYVPEVWGGRVQYQYGFNHRWLALGPELRLSKPWNEADWHIYGTVGASIEKDNNAVRPTLEFGARVAPGQNRGRFCFSSYSMGVMTNFDGVYLTFGFGLSVSVLATAFLALGLAGI